MSSFNLDFSGNIFLLILTILISVLLAIYSYSKTIPPISSLKKYSLIILRSLALSILLFIIFEPILTKITGKEIPPKVAVLIDKSKSMIANDASGSKEEIFKNVLTELNLNQLSKEQIILKSFENNVNDLKNLDSLINDGDFTNLSLPIRNINKISEEENIRSILMITDGAFNSGSNPLYDAEKFSKPINFIAIGDTNEPKDIILNSLISNDIAYVNNVIPININLISNGFSNDTLEISVFENTKVIDTIFVELNKNQNQYSVFSSYKPTEKGVKSIRAVIKSKQEEISTKNNTISKYIEVLDNKRIISIFSGYAYPDISFIKNSLLSVDGYEIQEFIQKNNSEFYTYPNDDKINNTDLFILIGFPISSTPAEILNKIKKNLEKGTPILFISGLNTNYARLRLLEENLPFNTTGNQYREYTARGMFLSDKVSNPLLKYKGQIIDAKIWNKLPPVFRTELFVNPKPESEILAKVLVNEVDLNEPLIMIRDFQNQSSAAYLGYGFFRWKLIGYASDAEYNEYDLFPELIKNTVKWLTVNKSKKLFDIKTTKDFYGGNEIIEFTAQVYDNALNPVENANIEIEIKDSSKTTRNVQMQSLGNGRYYQKIKGLPSGNYSYSGKAFLNSDILGNDFGKFSVGNVNIEYQNLTMNYNLLKNISNITSGKVYFPNETNSVISEIKSQKNFKSYPVTLKDEIALWNLAWLLAFSILLFAIEWIIRKRSGLV